jgi:surface antigen
MNGSTMRSTKLVALCLTAAFTFSASTAVAQVPDFGSVLGGVVGGAVGSRGGGGGAVAGAIIGMAAGAIIKGLIDDIERQKAKEAANRALKSGKGGATTFRNSKGQQVRVTTKARTYKRSDGQSCREISTTVQRDGRSDSGGGSETKCVQLASNFSKIMMQ